MKWLVRVPGFIFVLLMVVVLAVEFAPPRWVAKYAQRAINDRTNTSFSVDAIDLHVIGLYPSIRVEDLSVSHREAPDDHAQGKMTTFFGSVKLLKLFTGDLYVNELVANEGEVSAAINADGQGNWLYLIPDNNHNNHTLGSSGVDLHDATDAITAVKTDSETDLKADIATEDKEDEEDKEYEALSLPIIEKLSIKNFQLAVQDERIALDAQLQINAEASTSDPTPAKLNATGTLNKLPAKLDVTTNILSNLASRDKPLTMDADAQVGDTELSVDGSIASLDAIQEGELVFMTAAQGLGDMEQLIGLSLPVVPQFSLSGTLQLDGPEIVLHRFDGGLGDSDLQGDIRINPKTTPITVFANMISERLDLDDLAGFIGGEPDPTETASGQLQEDADDSDAGDAKRLPSDPIALATLASFFNGAIEFRAESIQSPVWPVQSMDTRIEIQGTDVTIDPLQISVADGDVAGSVLMNTAATPVQTEVALQINGVDIKPFLKKSEVDDDSFGILGGRVKYWVEGETIADMAASADGGLFLLMTQGKLDALLAELAGVDLFESLTLLIDPEQSRTDINCAYLDLQSDNGVSDIATLVLDTDDVVFLAEGTIDLNDESMDIVIEPHPKDTSILAAQTAAHIQGTFSDPSVQPGQTLYARAAAAAVLAAIASPAAALIPFVEAGTGSDSAYCEGMITALDDARD